MARKKVKPFNESTGVRKLARERVGAVPPARPIEPKDKRKKPKYKTPVVPDEE